MFKITNKKTGFFYYLQSHEVDMFFKRQDPYKYEVKEIRTLNKKEIFYGFLTLTLMAVFTIAFIYYETN